VLFLLPVAIALKAQGLIRDIKLLSKYIFKAMSQTEIQTQQQNPQKWEYLCIEILSIKLLGASSTQYNLEDKSIKSALKGKNLSDGLTYLGSQGWELVAAANGFSVGSNNLYLKRLQA
jgi:hypothetical protein